MTNLMARNILVYVILGSFSWTAWLIASTVYMNAVFTKSVSVIKVLKATILSDISFRRIYSKKKNDWPYFIMSWGCLLIWPIGLIINSCRMIIVINRLQKQK